MYSRVLFVALGFVAAVGTAIVYYVGGRMVIDGTISIGTLGALDAAASRRSTSR